MHYIFADIVEKEASDMPGIAYLNKFREIIGDFHL